MHIDELKEKRDQILDIAERNGARSIRVFGSIARGEAGSDSDVDFLVELEPGKTLFDIIAMKQDLEDLLLCKVDVVTRKAVSPYIRGKIDADAIAL